MIGTNTQRWVKTDKPNRWNVDVFFEVYSYYTNSEISKKHVFTTRLLKYTGNSFGCIVLKSKIK